MATQFENEHDLKELFQSQQAYDSKTSHDESVL